MYRIEPRIIFIGHYCGGLSDAKLMKAFVMEGIGKTAIVEKERSEGGPMDAVIKPTVGLICTSDFHTVHGAIGERENLTLGHEVVDAVEAEGFEIDGNAHTPNVAGLTDEGFELHMV